VSIESTVLALGIEGILRGSEFIAVCPQHEARTCSPDMNPSWSINIDTGLFLCFSCGYRGTLVTLISDIRGIPADEAKSLVVKPELATTLSKIPGAYPGITPQKILPEGRLSRYSQPPRWARTRRRISESACHAFGVRWDFTTDSWILPIRRSSDSALIGWQVKSEGQRGFSNFPAGVPKSSTLFGYDIFMGGRMIVVESPLDAVRLWSEGFHGAVATYGAIVSKAQVVLMTAADEVVFALDNPRIDDAGRKANERLLVDTKGVLKSVTFFEYGDVDAKDPGDMDTRDIDNGLRRARSRAYGAVRS